MCVSAGIFIIRFGTFLFQSKNRIAATPTFFKVFKNKASVQHEISDETAENMFGWLFIKVSHNSFYLRFVDKGSESSTRLLGLILRRAAVAAGSKAPRARDTIASAPHACAQTMLAF